MPALAYANGPVTRILTVVVGGLVVGVIVVGVVVVTASPLAWPTGPFKGRRSKTDTHFLFYHEMFTLLHFQVARLGWPASAMCVACIQPIR